MTLIPKHRAEDFSSYFGWLRPFNITATAPTFVATVFAAAHAYKLWLMHHTFVPGFMAFILMLILSVAPVLQLIAVTENYIYAQRHRRGLFRDYGRALQGAAFTGFGLAGLLTPQVVFPLVVQLAQ